MGTVLAALAGAGFVGACQVALGALLGGAPPIVRDRLFLVLCGDGALALLLGLVAARRRWPRAAACWVAALLALGPAAGEVAGGIWLGLPLGLAGAALARRLAWRRGALPAPPRALVPFAALPLLGSLAAVSILEPDRSSAPVPLPPPLPARETGSLAPAAGRPDVVLVVADTLRAEVLDDPELRTPALDALRARGVWAEAARAPSNQTLPSHLSLLMCLDVEKVGMRNNLHGWPRADQLRERWGCVPLAERFRLAGYRTAAVVSNPLLAMVDAERGDQGFDAGFEVWSPRDYREPWQDAMAWAARSTWIGYLTGVPWLGPRARRLLRELLDPRRVRVFRRSYLEGDDTLRRASACLEELAARPEPFFFFVHFMDPHSPYVAPEPYQGKLGGRERPAGIGAHPEWVSDAVERLRHAARAGRIGPEEMELGAWLRDRYREEVLYLDRLVGELVERLDASGRSTLFLFTADHGEMFGEHAQVEHGGSLYEGELAVPFILSGPGVPQNRRLEGTPELVDAARTLLELAGVGVERADGSNVLARDLRRPTFSVMFGRCAVVDGRWKLHCDVDYGPQPMRLQYELSPVALYDLLADPGEARNLLESAPPGDERQAVVERLLRFARERLASDLLPDLERRRILNRFKDNLADLGYAAGGDG